MDLKVEPRKIVLTTYVWKDGKWEPKKKLVLRGKAQVLDTVMDTFQGIL